MSVKADDVGVKRFPGSPHVAACLLSSRANSGLVGKKKDKDALYVSTRSRYLFEMDTEYRWTLSWCVRIFSVLPLSLVHLHSCAAVFRSIWRFGLSNTLDLHPNKNTMPQLQPPRLRCGNLSRWTSNRSSFKADFSLLSGSWRHRVVFIFRTWHTFPRILHSETS